MGFTNVEGCSLALPTARTEKERYNKEEIEETSGCFWPAGRKERQRLEAVKFVCPHFPSLDFGGMCVIQVKIKINDKK